MSNCLTGHEKFLDVTDNKENKSTGSSMNNYWISQLVKGKVCKRQMSLKNNQRGAQAALEEQSLARPAVPR